MTPPAGLEPLIGMLATATSQLSGPGGKAVRARLTALAEILASAGPEADLRARAALELEGLVAALGALAGASPPETAHAARAIDLGQLADGLRTFATYLREPTLAHQAEVERVVAGLQAAAAPAAVPLDELQIDDWITELARESTTRHGLKGGEQRRAIERIEREMKALIRQLEARAQQDAARANTAADAARLIDLLIETQTPLAHAVAARRAELVAAFHVVDLAHMAAGLQTFARWLSKAALVDAEPAAYVAELARSLGDALGPATHGSPLRSDAERRADFERDIRRAVEQILGGAR
ncbi:MAG TPA: hypothetical protein VFP84_11990 [Kofleriaceae bacterium]|nr:hypothetical protein [Kofleriaceae bacterium]